MLRIFAGAQKRACPRAYLIDWCCPCYSVAMDLWVDCLNRAFDYAAQAWVEEFERQHPQLIALLDGVKTEDEALARLSGLTLKELLSL